MLDALGIGAAIAAVAGGVAGAVAVPIVAGATAAQALLKFVQKHEEQAREERMKLLMDNLAQRLATVERKLDAQPEVDLAFECMARAIRDDDSRKSAFYASFLTWFINERRPIPLARMLCDAVHRLTYDELRSFSWWYRRIVAPGRLIVPIGLDRETLWARFAAAGLFPANGVVMREQTTLLGTTLVEILGTDFDAELATARTD